MNNENCLLELRGGRFDGYRKGLRFIPLQQRLEVRMASSGTGRPAPARVAVYELSRTSLAILDDRPTIVLAYEYTGSQGTAASGPAKRLFPWRRRLRRALRWMRRRIAG
jgi:hypothetical protein